MRGSRLLLLLLSSLLLLARGDIFHYYKMKKLITALAFARALGRRPTILPIPIPIPIPISQNEVIRVPAKRAKSILTLTGSPKYSKGYSSGGFTGSSSFGYPLPGSFDSTSLGGSKIMVLDGNNILDATGGSEFASPSNVIRLVSGKPRRFNRRPNPFVLSGNGLMRHSEYTDFVQPPARQFKKKTSKQNTTRKKPIPVGERFRLP